MSHNLEINRPVRAVEDFLLKHIPVSVEISGSENIDEALRLLDQGYKGIIETDHRSTADAMTGLAATQQSETRWGELFGRTTALLKESYFDLFKIPISGFKVIGVVSPTMVMEREKADKINKEALILSKKIPVGEAESLEPEATRVRSGGMQVSRPEMTLYWNRNPGIPEDRIFFVPVALEGTEQQLPQGPMGISYYFLYGKRCISARFIFGKPFLLTDVKAILSSGIEPWGNKRQMEADLVFLQVARLHIYHPDGNPDYADGEPILDPKTGELLENGGGYYTRLNDRLVAAGVQFPDDFKDLSSS